MSRPGYFGTPRKGETFELRGDLNSEYRERRKDGIKRVIANMTVGKDVSALFPDVLKNMQTEDLEQKKLVYLYLMNYAKTQPELVILAVNTFVKDAEDPNPLVRALAIRTMGCLRAEKIIDYLPEPLRRALADESPYVRKTAVICVAKLFSLKPELALEGGFVDHVKSMITDNNPMVVANAVAALNDIHETAQELRLNGEPVFVLDSDVLMKLLIALNECSEWGRLVLLQTLAAYRSADAREAEHICERVIPQFQHANGSVVLGAVKVVLVHMEATGKPEFVQQLIRKMAPPLVTLVTSEPEVQWVALRNINLILQKYPEILQNELRVFFCKYNDPPYVKAEKVDVMIKLAKESNVDMLLSELKEYATEVDVEFVRRAIRAIGQCAIAIEAAAERCVYVLLELIDSRVNYVVQEATVVVKDIFRKYPHQYTRIIPQLCANMDEMDEPEAKAALVWILGEYAEKIDNVAEQLAVFLEHFVDDEPEVQFQTLTAIVKLFLKKPESGLAQKIVQDVLEKATQACDNADLRDRAFIYWRLLSSADGDAARAVVLAPAPPISIPLTTVSRPLLNELLREISLLSSVYHKPASTFIGHGRMGLESIQALHNDEAARSRAIATVAQGEKSEALLDLSDDAPAAAATATQAAAQSLGSLGDLLGDDAFSTPAMASSAARAPAPGAAPAAMDDLLGIFDTPAPAPAPAPTTAASSNLLDLL
ncbi:Similar to S.cerevisiae protein APL2 (Beta-adaptin subunit of the clathrin-associated protein (AP-1) complex) [Malassezia sympodialis ATCC 42132]|uniref:AP complex subunit beta n=1 Tax=Malassezia sympodialis (strain ATCC 42132) TaxID=1230383 RepID=A0A1M8A7H0_MALS4|nr:Similar to S.cerevisiae protein APL2 (Beta-adaptin subunit of the clathrin-associated protein (AP-1) complex) [Malassezia sympodialis ATCC 42132]